MRQLIGRYMATPVLLPILLVNFIGSLGYSIVLPFLVVLVLKFGGNELVYGILGATYSFFQFIGAPILGTWSDKQGRRKILILSQGGTLLAWVIFYIALTIPNTVLGKVESQVLGIFLITIPLLMLFFARALDGITGGNISVAYAYLSDITSDEDRKKNFGKMAASGNLGFIVGPAMAGLLGGSLLGDKLPVLAAILISAFAVYLIYFKLTESKPCTLKNPADQLKARKLLGMEHVDCQVIEEAKNIKLTEIIRLKHIPQLLIVYFLIFLAFNFFYVAFPVHAVNSLNWSILDLGIFFSVLSAIMVVVQGPLLSIVSRRFSDLVLVISGSIMLAVCFFLFRYPSTLLIYVGVVFFSFGNGIMWPSFLAVLSKTAGDHYQGAIQGFASSSGSIASIIGLISGGVFYGMMSANLFIVPALIMIIIIPFILNITGTSRTKDAKTVTS
jgi:MFS family permease